MWREDIFRIQSDPILHWDQLKHPQHLSSVLKSWRLMFHISTFRRSCWIVTCFRYIMTSSVSTGQCPLMPLYCCNINYRCGKKSINCNSFNLIDWILNQHLIHNKWIVINPNLNAMVTEITTATVALSKKTDIYTKDHQRRWSKTKYFPFIFNENLRSCCNGARSPQQTSNKYINK